MTEKKILELFIENLPITPVKRGMILPETAGNKPRVWYLKRGYVRQAVTGKDNGEVNFHIYKPGSVFPLMWLLTGKGSRYQYITVTDAELVEINDREFMALLDRHPELVTYFTRRLLLGINGLLSRLESLIVDDVDTRLTRFFIYFADSFGQNKNDGSTLISVPLTHQAIASWIGTARETTTLAVKRLLRKRVISKSGKYYRVNVSVVREP